MKAAVGAFLVVAALLTWWLWRTEAGRPELSRSGAEARDDADQPVPAGATNSADGGSDAPLEPAVIEGVVRCGAEPIWNARITIHEAGREVAFDEVGSDVNGRYRIEVPVGAEGESVDLRARPADDSVLAPAWLRYVELRPGVHVQQDFALEGGVYLSCSVRKLGEDFLSRAAIELAAVPWEDWNRIRGPASFRLPPYAALRAAAAGTVRGQHRLRFPELPDGEYAVVCVTPGWEAVVTPRARPGEVVPVEVRRIPGLLVTLLDGTTGEPVRHARVVADSGGGGRVLEASPYEAGQYFLELSGAARTEFGRWTIRAEAEGYHPTEIPIAGLLNTFRESVRCLVPTGSPSLRIRATGTDAASFLRALRIELNGRVGSRTAVLVAPKMVRTDGSVAFVLPAGNWTLRATAGPLTAWTEGGPELQIRAGSDVEWTLHVPTFAVLECGDATPSESILRATVVRAPTLRWVELETGRWHLVQVAGEFRRLNAFDLWDEAARGLRVPPGPIEVSPPRWVTRDGRSERVVLPVEARAGERKRIEFE